MNVSCLRWLKTSILDYTIIIMCVKFRPQDQKIILSDPVSLNCFIFSFSQYSRIEWLILYIMCVYCYFTVTFLMSSSVWISGESPPCTQRNCWFIRAARGRQSNASMQESYTCSEYLILPRGGRRGKMHFKIWDKRSVWVCFDILWRARTVSPCHSQRYCYISHTDAQQRTNKHGGF